MKVCVFKVEIAYVLYLLCEYVCIYWLGIKLALHGYECTHDLVNPTCISAPRSKPARQPEILNLVICLDEAAD